MAISTSTGDARPRCPHCHHEARSEWDCEGRWALAEEQELRCEACGGRFRCRIIEHGGGTSFTSRAAE
jgi:transcription elongation factor Elf1